MNLKHFRRTAVAFVAAAAFALMSASIGLAAQGGRPASPPGQANHPATPARAGSPPQTPPGQAKAPQTPPGQAKAAAPIVVKPALASNLQPLLPPGMSMTAASAGFKNLGAFVSALHISHNLDIPFAALRTSIVTNGNSLGAAIQTLKPAANVKLEVERAEKQARDDIARSNAH